MFFSVCVAVYNAAQYLEESVNSILSQDFKDFEILLIDDCSGDNSGKICDSLEEQFPETIRVIHHSKNQGLLIARRTFFAAAKGEWFIAVDADDLLKEGALRTLYDTIMKNKCDLVLYDLECISLDGSTSVFSLDIRDNYVYSGVEKKTVYEQIYFNNNINSICTKAIHRDLIDYEIDYSQWKDLRFGTDIFQSYPLFDRATGILYLKQSLYVYIKRNNAITTKWHTDWYRIRHMLYIRDKMYRQQWRLGNNIDALEAERYIRGTVSYLDRQCRKTPKYKLMYRWYESIYQDGDIGELLLLCNKLKLRHSLYARCIVHKKYRLLFMLQIIFCNIMKLLER